MTVENIRDQNSVKECCRPGGDRIRNLLTDAHPTKPPWLAIIQYRSIGINITLSGDVGPLALAFYLTEYSWEVGLSSPYKAHLLSIYKVIVTFRWS